MNLVSFSTHKGFPLRDQSEFLHNSQVNVPAMYRLFVLGSFD